MINLRLNIHGLSIGEVAQTLNNYSSATFKDSFFEMLDQYNFEGYGDYFSIGTKSDERRFRKNAFKQGGVYHSKSGRVVLPEKAEDFSELTSRGDILIRFYGGDKNMKLVRHNGIPLFVPESFSLQDVD